MRIWHAAEFCLIVERQTRSEAWKRSRRFLTNHQKHSKQIMTGCLLVDTNDQPVYKIGDAKRKQELSKVRVEVQPGGHVAHLHAHAQETEGVPVSLSAKSLTALGTMINFETGHAIFRNLEPRTVVQLQQSYGTLVDESVRTMPVVSNSPWSLFGLVKQGTHVGLIFCEIRKLTSWLPKMLLVLILNAHPFLDRRTRLTLLTRRQCDDREFRRRKLCH